MRDFTITVKVSNSGGDSPFNVKCEYPAMFKQKLGYDCAAAIYKAITPIIEAHFLETNDNDFPPDAA